MGYPTTEEEVRLMRDRLVSDPAEDIEAVMTAEELADCIDDVKRVEFSESLCRYVAELSAATRNHPAVELGASPRASLAMMNAARAFAYISGRDYVVPEDIAHLLVPVYAHRIRLRQEVRMKKKDITSVLSEVASSVTPPLRG